MTIAAYHPGRRSKQYSQADRIVRIMRALASRGCTLKELAQEFAVSLRQAHRDLKEIEIAGHPLTCSDGPGEKTWQLPLGYKGLPQIAVSPYELLSLHLAKSHLAYLKNTPFHDDLDSVIGKVQAGLPAKTANHLERIVHAFAPLQRGAGSYAEKNNQLQALKKALLLQFTVDISYKKPEARKASTYRVDPYALLLHQYGLYVVGYSHRTQAERLFAVDRIKEVELTEDRFEIPPAYSAVDRYAQQFGLIDEQPQEIKIRFSPAVAHLMIERQWHSSQRVKKLKDESVEVTFRAGGLDEIAWWVLSWGKEAKVLSPPKLVAIVTEQLTKSLKRYS